MPNSLNFTRGAGQDKTLRTVTQDAQQLAYAATISVTPIENVNFYQVAQLTGALTINASVNNLFIGDRVRFMFAADATNRVVTFGTGFVSAGTVTVTASKFASAEFVFNGTSLQEVSRAVTV